MHKILEFVFYFILVCVNKHLFYVLFIYEYLSVWFVCNMLRMIDDVGAMRSSLFFQHIWIVLILYQDTLEASPFAFVFRSSVGCFVVLCFSWPNLAHQIKKDLRRINEMCGSYDKHKHTPPYTRYHNYDIVFMFR